MRFLASMAGIVPRGPIESVAGANAISLLLNRIQTSNASSRSAVVCPNVPKI